MEIKSPTNKPTPLRITFQTLGCRLNIAETGAIKTAFQDGGYKIVEYGGPADLVFLNTCTVTNSADASCRNLIRKSKQEYPDANIIVAGCYAQMEAESIRTAMGVDVIIGTAEKANVLAHVNQFLNSQTQGVVATSRSSSFWVASNQIDDDHTRAFLKIQDGCNYICSYCIIPFARGRSKSISLEQAKEECQALIEKGFKEITLTGINIGEYQGANQETFDDLLQNLINLEGLERLRLSSVEPNTITDNLLAILKQTTCFQDHFHIPLQSGDDTILTQMKRKYDTALFTATLNKIMQAFPRAGIGSDIIVGFPGETDQHFQNTYDLLKKLPITHFHVFPYSSRTGTLAAKQPDQIPTTVKKQRARRLRDLGNLKLAQFIQKQVGQTNQVLFENQNKAGHWQGYSSNYIKIQVPSNQVDLKNKVCRVMITQAHADYADAVLLT